MDIRIHAREPGMTEDEAMSLMVDSGFQERSEAAEKWNRARLSSTQLCEYFLGSAEMTDLEHERDAAPKSIDASSCGGRSSRASSATAPRPRRSSGTSSTARPDPLTGPRGHHSRRCDLLHLDDDVREVLRSVRGIGRASPVKKSLIAPSSVTTVAGSPDSVQASPRKPKRARPAPPRRSISPGPQRGSR